MPSESFTFVLQVIETILIAAIVQIEKYIKSLFLRLILAIKNIIYQNIKSFLFQVV